MKNLIVNKVTTYHIDALTDFAEPRIYHTESDIIYEGQIPHAGYLLLEGEIHFIKRKKVIQKIQAGTLFGVSELMNNSPLKFTVRILPNSKVSILDKSTVKEILKEGELEKLPPALQQIAI